MNEYILTIKHSRPIQGHIGLVAVAGLMVSALLYALVYVSGAGWFAGAVAWGVALCGLVLVGMTVAMIWTVGGNIRWPMSWLLMAIAVLDCSLLVQWSAAAWAYHNLGLLSPVHGALSFIAGLVGHRLPSDVAVSRVLGSTWVLGDSVYALEGVLSWLPLVAVVYPLVLHAVLYLLLPRDMYMYYVNTGSADPLGFERRWGKWGQHRERAPLQAVRPADDAQAQGGEEQDAIVYRAKKPRHDFSAVIGAQEVKDVLLETVQRFQTEDGNGILFAGDPGNGKTFLAEALAGELGWNFLELRAGELTSKWMGETTENVMRAMRDVRKQAPVVLFLDEFDSFMTNRGSLAGDGQAVAVDALRSANALLTELSSLNRGFNQHRVLIVAATNHLDNLDQAGVRDGRFDQKIVVPPPNMDARLAILRRFLPKEAKVNQTELVLTARRWEGWSASRLQNIGKLAAAALRKNPARVVDADFLREMVDQLTKGMGTPLAENLPTLDELHFHPDLKRRLRMLTDMLREPERVERVGARLPRGAIFYGPPGTGKTLVAQVLAKETGWRFLATSGALLLEAPGKIDAMIAKARDIRPCIVFIDEAESVLRDRQGNPLGKEITNKLLSVMDGPQKLHDVFFVAATNFPDGLDEAIVREGRFSEHFDFTPADEAIVAVVRDFMSNTKDVRWLGSAEDFVARYPGLSPANAIGHLNRALRDACMQLPNQDARPVLDLRAI